MTFINNVDTETQKPGKIKYKDQAITICENERAILEYETQFQAAFWTQEEKELHCIFQI